MHADIITTISGTVTYFDDVVIEVQKGDLTVEILHNGILDVEDTAPGEDITCQYETEYVEAFDTGLMRPQHTLVDYVLPL